MDVSSWGSDVGERRRAAASAAGGGASAGRPRRARGAAEFDAPFAMSACGGASRETSGPSSYELRRPNSARGEGASGARA